ncbi:MAG: polysaccharide deacetylase family protein [bacterium]
MKYFYLLLIPIFIFTTAGVVKDDSDLKEVWPGVVQHFSTDKKEVALTIDFCRGMKNKSSYDDKLISTLIKEKIPATLFMTKIWIEANKNTAKKLVTMKQFDIENHGENHYVCSTTGKSVYHIKACQSVEEVQNEVLNSGKLIKEITGKQPTFFRGATAQYDQGGAETIVNLGYKIAGYAINGDGGATFKEKDVKNAFLSAKPGDIIIIHGGHPEGNTAEGVISVIQEMKKKGMVFRLLRDVIK